jgi:mRNA interferase RelE/StbE
MKIGFDKKFEKDFDRVPSEIQKAVKSAIQNVLETNATKEISNLKKLTGFKHHYRIKIGSYRIGIYLENDETIIFSRILHRKEIYRFFPKK